MGRMALGSTRTEDMLFFFGRRRIEPDVMSLFWFQRGAAMGAACTLTLLIIEL
jgi:hypothetical protein